MKLRRYINKKLASLVGALLLLTASILVIMPTTPAQAAPTPESCFNFNAASKTITLYRRFFDLSCPKDVEIPDSIGGVPVEVIGYDAFFNTGITSVIIPDSVITLDSGAFYTSGVQSVTFGNSVETIGDEAFSGASLTSVTLPSSLKTIGIDAFVGNNLTSVTIPSSVTFISGSAFECWDTNQFYKRITLENFANPYGLQDSHGCYLINSASVTLQFKNTGGDTLSPEQVIIGDGVSDYLTASNPTGDFSLYYRIGDVKTFTAPEVEGYQTPVDKTVTLTAADNTVTFVYEGIDDGSEDTAPNQATLATSTTSKPVVIQAPEDATITCSNALKESTQTKQDGSYEYPLGLVEFCFDTEQADNTVSLIFVTDLKPSEVTARKYNSVTQTYFDIADASITETQHGGQHALRLTYTITDNGVLDLDPAVGSIKDPAGLAVIAESSSLALTGSNVMALGLLTSLLVVSSTAYIVMRHVKKNSLSHF